MLIYLLKVPQHGPAFRLGTDLRQTRLADLGTPPLPDFIFRKKESQKMSKNTVILNKKNPKAFPKLSSHPYFRIQGMGYLEHQGGWSTDFLVSNIG